MERLFLIFLSAAILLSLACMVEAVVYPYPLDYGEAPLLDQAMRLAAGEGIYHVDLSSPSYTVSNYPPLYILLITPFVRHLGPSFVPGRILSALAALCSAVFVALIVYEVTRDRPAAAVAGGFLLVNPFVVYWASLGRVDMLALALSLMGSLFALRQRTIASALSFVASIYTRQTYMLAAPLAAFAWSWGKDRRQAWRLAAITGGISLLLFGVLDFLSAGGFCFNTVVANVNELSWEWLRWNWQNFCWVHHISLVVGLITLILAWHGERKSWRFWLAPYLIGAALVSLTVAKVGSSLNYFLELIAALALAVGMFFAWARERSGDCLRKVILALLILQVVGMLEVTLVNRTERFAPPDEVQQLEKAIAEVSGPVLADEYAGLLVLQERSLYIQPFEVSQLARAEVWGQRSFVESIRAGEFPLILIQASTRRERWTSEMLGALEEAYVVTDVLAGTHVYRPVGR